MKKTLDWNKYLAAAVQTVSEGIVMLKNNNAVLPLAADEEIAVFGRMQFHYYKSGTGSGGMVNVSKVIGIPEGLVESGIKLNKELSLCFRICLPFLSKKHLLFLFKLFCLFLDAPDIFCGFIP